MQSDLRVSLVEDANDHLLAVDRRQRRNAQIDTPAHGVDDDPSVLRTALFGNIHSRHDLDPRRNGRVKPEREVERVEELAVHTIPDVRDLFKGLDVDVRSAFTDGLFDHAVHELYDRGVVRSRFRDGTCEVELAGALSAFDDLDHRVFHGVLYRVEALDIPGYVGRRRKRRVNLHSGEHSKLVERHDIERICCRYPKASVLLDTERDDLKPLRDVLRNLPERIGQGTIPRQRNERELELQAQRLHELAFGDPPL